MMNPIEHAIGRRVQRLRQRSGLSRTELASVAGTTADHIKRIEHGEKRLAPELALDLAATFNVRISYLIAGLGAAQVVDLSESHPDIVPESERDGFFENRRRYN